MMDLNKVEFKRVYNDNTEKVEERSLWFFIDDFSFIHEKNLRCIYINNVRINNQKEFDIFYKGVNMVRDILISFANKG